jgi:hypothetical protein
VADVTKDFSVEIVDGRKDASRDDLPLNFGEPDFDLVKPGRIGGCKMNAHLRLARKSSTSLVSVGRAIISDDVDLLTCRLGGTQGEELEIAYLLALPLHSGAHPGGRMRVMHNLCNKISCYSTKGLVMLFISRPCH